MPNRDSIRSFFSLSQRGLNRLRVVATDWAGSAWDSFGLRLRLTGELSAALTLLRFARSGQGTGKLRWLSSVRISN